ncbi:MAG: SH3 domain-containing protein [Desulfobacterota bacterium]|nr:SH3 domain-containing protein [Thermodesulfobacteriota bacterium]
MVFPFIFFLLSGCSGTRPDTKKAEESPPSSVERKLEEPSKEAAPTPQPPLESQKQVPPAAPSAPPIPETPKPSPPPQPVLPQPPPPRTVKILWESVNLREGPGLQHKVVGVVRKGTTLIVLDEMGNWLRVRLESGKEAWVSKAATSEAPKPPPPPPKPKPM